MPRTVNKTDNTYIVYFKKVGEQTPIKSQMNYKENVFSIEKALTLDEAMTNARTKYLDYGYLPYHCRTYKYDKDYTIDFLEVFGTYIENILCKEMNN